MAYLVKISAAAFGLAMVLLSALKVVIKRQKGGVVVTIALAPQGTPSDQDKKRIFDQTDIIIA